MNSLHVTCDERTQLIRTGTLQTTVQCPHVGQYVLVWCHCDTSVARAALVQVTQLQLGGTATLKARERGKHVCGKLPVTVPLETYERVYGWLTTCIDTAPGNVGDLVVVQSGHDKVMARIVAQLHIGTEIVRCD